MFTGIVQEIGVLREVVRTGGTYLFSITARRVLQDIKRGDSIAVNGVCLTVIDFNGNSFNAELMPETLKASNLGDLKPGALLNLEQAVRAKDFLGGHIVTGHVDGIGVVKSIRKNRNAYLVEIGIKKDLTRYLVEKGSIAVNGVSLTIMELYSDSFLISLTRETWNSTNLHCVKTGDSLNIETDLLGKYVYKILKNYFGNKEFVPHHTTINREFLIENGFI